MDEVDGRDSVTRIERILWMNPDLFIGKVGRSGGGGVEGVPEKYLSLKKHTCSDMFHITQL